MRTAEDIVKDKHREIVSISWDRTIQDACQKMVDLKIGAILIRKDDTFVGIWTERDLLRKITEEGFDPKTDEYYTEVDKRIRLEFPHKFDKIEETTTERAKPAQNVASARRSASTNKGRKTVKLTPSQVAIAKRLGVPLEEYAKQLNITEGV